MKNFYFLLAVVVSLLLGTAPGSAQIQSPYDYDFNTAIDVSSHSFALGAKWGHIVDHNGSSYVSYIYSSDGGVDDSGCLRIGGQIYYDSDLYEEMPLCDCLVTPALTAGDATISAAFNEKSGSYFQASAKITFYSVTGSGSTLKIGKQLDSESLGDSFKEYKLPAHEAGERIAICASYAKLDNFHAEGIDVTPQPGLEITSLNSINGKTVDADADGNYTVGYNVIVKNTGEVDLTKGMENYSLSLVNGTDTLITQTIDQDVTVGKSSKYILLTKKLNIAQYPDAARYDVVENITHTSKSGSTVTPVPYRPIITLSDSANTKNVYTNSDSVYFGANKGESRTFRLVNDGAAELQISDVSVTGPFQTNLKAQTLAAHQNVFSTISVSDETAGDKLGNITITTNDSVKNIVLKAYVPDETKWYADFEDGLPKDMLGISTDNKWNTNSYPADAGYVNNKQSASVANEAIIASPLLEVRAGDKLIFEAANQYPSSRITVSYSKDRKTWTKAKSFSGYTDFSKRRSSKSNYYNEFTKFTVDNIPSGQYYIAFDGSYLYLDNINGFTPVNVAHDLLVTSQDFPKSGMINYEYNPTITLKNTLAKAEAASSYKAQLYFGDELVDTTSALEIGAGAEQKFQFSYVPHEAGTFKAYAVFDFGGYKVFSDTVDVAVAAESFSNNVQIGGEITDWEAQQTPWSYFWNDSENQTIYTPAELGGLKAGDVITSITLRGKNVSSSSYYTTEPYELSTLGVYIGETSETKGDPNKPISKSELTRVYYSKYTIPTGGSLKNPIDLISVSIPDGYTYEGGNLVVRLERYANQYNSSVSFLSNKGITDQSIERHSDSYSELSSADYSNVDLPIIYLGIKATSHTVSGKVTYADGSPIAGQRVDAVAGRVSYDAITATDGTYSMEIVQQDKEYTLSVKRLGYFPFVKKFSVADSSIVVNPSLNEAKGLFIDSAAIVGSTVNKPITATATISNYTNKNFASKDYIAKLLVNGEAVDSIATVDLKQNESHVFTFSYVPHASGTYKAYVQVLSDGVSYNSDAVNLNIADETSNGFVQVGDSVKLIYNSPLGWVDDGHLEGEFIYPASLINLAAGTKIRKVVFRGYASSLPNNPRPRFYIENTDETYADVDETKFVLSDTTKMTKALADSITTERGDKQNLVDLYTFTFDNFIYTGGNLKFTFIIDEDSWNNFYVVSQDDKSNCFYKNGPDNKEFSRAFEPVAYLTVSYENNITGSVVDEKGEPVANATVTLKSGDVIYTGMTDTDGIYNVPVLQSGLDYDLTVSAENYKDTTINIGVVTADAEETTIALEPADATAIVSIRTGGNIAGVHAANGAIVVESGPAVIYNISGQIVSKVNASAGSATVKVPQGLYIVNGKKVLVK